MVPADHGDGAAPGVHVRREPAATPSSAVNRWPVDAVGICVDDGAPVVRDGKLLRCTGCGQTWG